MSLEIVIGPMFSGKSSYALNYIRRRKAIKKQVIVIKPNIDNRYSNSNVIVTHDNESAPCYIWDYTKELEVVPVMFDVDYILFEESQFFKGLLKIVKKLMLQYGKNVVVVGLDGDAHQRPFGEILDCIPWASNVIKLNAMCSRCNDGTLAHYTRRIIDNHSDQVEVGGQDKYESICLKHLCYIE